MSEEIKDVYDELYDIADTSLDAEGNIDKAKFIELVKKYFEIIKK